VTYINSAVGQAGVMPETAAQREHLASALRALGNLVEAHPKLAALLASRPALAPLLATQEPITR
jgi:hypothetical protein